MPNSYSFFSVCQKYFGNTVILPLAVMAVVWLLRKWNKYKQRAFLLVAVVSSLILYNEVIYYLAGKAGEAETYYRFFWICPLVLIIANFFVEIVFSTKGIKRLIILGMLFFGVFCFRSKSLSTWINIPENVYQIDSEVVDIADIILDMEDGNQTSVFDNGDIGYTIRQYTSQICFTELEVETMDYILSGCNSNYIGRYLIEYFFSNNSEYYILQKEKPSVCKIVESIGLKKVAESKNYYIYHLDRMHMHEERKWIREQEKLCMSMFNLEYIQLPKLKTITELVYVSDFGAIENETIYKNAMECIGEIQPDTIIINSELSEQQEWYIEKKAELDSVGIIYYCNNQEIQVIEQDGFLICMIDNSKEVTEVVEKKLEDLNTLEIPIILVLSAEINEKDNLYSLIVAEDSQVVQVLSARKNVYYKSVLEEKIIQYAIPTDNNTIFNVIRVEGK